MAEMQELGIRAKRGKFDRYLDRLVLMLRIPANGNGARMLLTPRAMQALDDPEWVVLGSDGNGRFGIKKSNETHPKSLKVAMNRRGSVREVAANSIALELHLTPLNKTYILVYEASHDGVWLAVDTAIDKPSRL